MLESISPTFFEPNCATFFAPKKSLTFTSITNKLRAKLSYEKAAHKMLVKLATTYVFFCTLRNRVETDIGRHVSEQLWPIRRPKPERESFLLESLFDFDNNI
jgi:hypothetical protein